MKSASDSSIRFSLRLSALLMPFISMDPKPWLAGPALTMGSEQAQEKFNAAFYAALKHYLGQKCSLPVQLPQGVTVHKSLPGLNPFLDNSKCFHILDKR